MRIFVKALIVVACFLVMAVDANAQSEQAKVTLKNGTEVTGVIKSFNPASAIVLDVAGFETIIDMSEVQKVEKVAAGATSEAGQSSASASPAANLPKEKIVNIAGVDVRFILIEGGKFTYGYDGPGSFSVYGEPVHEVLISSFYVTELPITQDLVEAVMGNNPLKGYVMASFDRQTSISTDSRCLTHQAPIDETNKNIMFFNAVKDDFHEDLENLYFRFYGETPAKSLPVALDFLNECRNVSGGMDLDIMTETQWAYAKSVYNEKFNTPFLPEIVRSVSMYANQDPVGNKIMLKGTEVVVPGFGKTKVSGVQNRASYPLNEIDENKKVLRIGFAKRGAYCIAPMHLVMSAK